MSATTDETIRVLENVHPKRLTAAEIYAAGNFDGLPVLHVALHSMCLQMKPPKLIRERQDGKPFAYGLVGMAAPARMVRLMDGDKIDQEPPQKSGMDAQPDIPSFTDKQKAEDKPPPKPLNEKVPCPKCGKPMGIKALSCVDCYTESMRTKTPEPTNDDPIGKALSFLLEKRAAIDEAINEGDATTIQRAIEKFRDAI